MLSVAIALEPPTEPAVVQAIARSCEEAIGAGRCKAAGEVVGGNVVAWYALVRLDDPAVPLLKIEFHDRDASGTLIEARELSFSERDRPENRWASAGAVIAAFVAAREGPGSSAPRPAPPPRPLPAPAPEPAPSHRLAWNADLALFTGPGLDRGSYRLGGLGRGYLALPDAPGVLGLISFRYSERPGDLMLAWWSASCGMGARLGGRATPLSAELTGEFVFERLTLNATNQTTAEQQAAAQNRFGGRLSVNLALRVVGGLGLVAGAEATALRPSVAVSVGDEAAGRAPAVGYAFSAGLRFSSGD
jgi:hypothetical protein